LPFDSIIMVVRFISLAVGALFTGSLGLPAARKPSAALANSAQSKLCFEVQVAGRPAAEPAGVCSDLAAHMAEFH